MVNRFVWFLLIAHLIGCGGTPEPPSEPPPQSAENPAVSEGATATEGLTTATGALEAPVDSVGSSGQSTEPFSISQICKAGIGMMMGRDPAVMDSRVAGGIVFLSYIREDDGTEWKYKCRLEGNRIMWGADDGRWRDNPADEALFFKVSEGRLEVEERYGDGSSSQETFSLGDLGE